VGKSPGTFHYQREMGAEKRRGNWGEWSYSLVCFGNDEENIAQKNVFRRFRIVVLIGKNRLA
jgi:hypothetical protein